MQHYSIQQLIAEGSQALATGGFNAFYTAQVAAFLRHLPHFNYTQFADSTQRAVKPLTTAADLLAYNACYAADHFARFTHLLTHVQAQSSQVLPDPVRLSVFDYGCGQGLATLALLNHLQQREVELVIHLIEPSALALQAARQYVSAFATRLNGTLRIHTYACGLDQLDQAMFVMPKGHSAVHLFSNVLDMAHKNRFDLRRLTAQLNNMQGRHVCLAVSPKYFSGRMGFDQLKTQFAPQQPSGLLVDTDCWTVSATSHRLGMGLQTRMLTGQYMALIRRVPADSHTQVA
jgi:SAM-dependent methyltransferase